MSEVEEWHPDAVDLIEQRKPPKKIHTCNRHSDCDEADEKARERGRYTDHCYDDCCEDCFGK